MKKNEELIKFFDIPLLNACTECQVTYSASLRVETQLRVVQSWVLHYQWYTRCFSFANCVILRVKIIRTNPLEPNIGLSYVSYAVLQLFCNTKFSLRRSKRHLFFIKHGD